MPFSNLYTIFMVPARVFTSSLHAIRYDDGIKGAELKGAEMQDVLFLATVLAFFAVAAGYTYGCDRL